MWFTGFDWLLILRRWVLHDGESGQKKKTGCVLFLVGIALNFEIFVFSVIY